jgi:hypothetical protein
MVKFPGESRELSCSGQLWHRVERLEHIVGWFDKWLRGGKPERNKAMVDRGRWHGQSEELLEYFAFAACNVNKWEPSDSFDVAIANHSLHHNIELELIFALAEQD